VEQAKRAGIVAVEVRAGLKEAFAMIFPEGADIVVDAAGVPQVVPQAIELLHAAPWDPLRDTPGGRYLLQGTFEECFPVPYAGAYAAQASILVPRGSQVADWQAAMDMLERGEIRLRDLIGAVRRPEDAEEIYADLATPDTGFATAAFDWR
jgi:threonine dehydrogenase-like Zn-dependent dehydrogenase